MARAFTSYTATVSGGTAAAFAAASSALSSMLGAAFSKTTDTGQTSPAALAAYSSTPPGSASTSALYEVFAFTDSLQATRPVYVRAAYGLDGVAVTVGTSTNGAGVIGGTAFGLPVTTLGNANSAVQRYAYAASGDGTFMNLLLNVQGQAATLNDALGAIVIERTRDADGTANGDGLNLWLWNTSGNATLALTINSWLGKYGRDFANTGTQQGAIFDPGAVVPYAATLTNWSSGSNNYAFPVYQHLNNTVYGASKALLLGGVNDYARQSIYTVTHYGTSMQFLSEGPGQPMSVPYASAANAATSKNLWCPLFRYE